jgi:hypothetical protein
MQECCHGHGCSSNGSSPKQQAPTEPDKHKDCPGTCEFLPVSKTQMDGDQDFTLVLSAASIPLATEAVFTTKISSCWGRYFNSLHPAPPLRLHLLNQIQLI